MKESFSREIGHAVMMRIEWMEMDMWCNVMRIIENNESAYCKFHVD